MKIYQDILKLQQFGAKKAAGPLQVIDTCSLFLQQVSEGCQYGKIIDGSVLLDSISEVCRYTYNYEYGLNYGNIAPLYPAVWLELTDRETDVHMAAYLAYERNDGQPHLQEQAKRHNIGGSFRWCCRTRCFIKRVDAKTLPLKWEWLEYIDAQGKSVGGVMQAIAIPGVLETFINEELIKMQFVQSDVCALIANLALYTMDMLNQGIASLHTYKRTKHAQLHSKHPLKFDHCVLDLNFSNSVLTALIST